LGWRLDVDFVVGDTFRVVQFTPPGSSNSIHFDRGSHQPSPVRQAERISLSQTSRRRVQRLSEAASTAKCFTVQAQESRQSGRIRLLGSVESDQTTIHLVDRARRRAPTRVGLPPRARGADRRPA
jgi:hypothetical protein